MQTTVGSDLIDHGEGLGLLFSTAIGGLALAIAAFAGLGGFEGNGQSAPASAPPPAAHTSVSAFPAARLLVYLVDSEAEKLSLEHDVATSPVWFPESYAAAYTEVRILILESEQEQSLETLARLIPEASLATGAGPALKLLDLR